MTNKYVSRETNFAKVIINFTHYKKHFFCSKEQIKMD